MSATKVQIKYGYGTPAPGSLKLAELAIDLNDESLWTADNDGKIVRVGHNTDGIEIDIDQILEELKDRVLHNDERNIIEEGAFQIVWRDSDPSYPSFNGTIGYSRGASDNPNSVEGSFIFAEGVNSVTGGQAVLSIGRDADLELEGDNAIRGKAGAGAHIPIIEGFKHVQADDFLDANGNSIIGNHDGDIANLQGQINDNATNISNNAEGISNNAEGISNNANDIESLRNDFDNHDHALDDLSDVSAANPSRDDLLVWTGTSWSASSFDLIETALNFKGSTNVAQAAPSAEQGDLYVNNTQGTAAASWTGIAGKVVNAGNFIGYANSRWYLLGEIADIGVTNLVEGLAISVDDSKPAEPVVSVNRAETDKWYADKGHDHSGVYEPVISPKNSAFNKNFSGSGSANTVSRSDHTHAGVYEPVINPKNSAFNKNFSGSGSADTVSRSDHTHTEYLTTETVSAGSGSTVSNIKIVVGKTGTDPNTLYFVV